MQFKDKIDLVDQALHVLDTSGDLYDLNVLHVQQPADLAELGIAPSIHLINDQDDRLGDRKKALNVLDDLDVPF